MKCVRVHRFGGPEVLQVDELTQLMPGEGEFVLTVLAAGVNPVDGKTRAGDFPPVKAGDLPVTLGRDVAGVVARVGEGVEGLVVGDKVLAHLGFDRGGYAEEAIVRSGEWARIPDAVEMNTAGALPLAADTAWQGLFDHGGLAAGETVLIHGASGGVGHLAVQFAKVRGARVIATAGHKNLDFVRGLGADEVIDHEKARFDERVHRVDLVFDVVGGETRQRSWAVLKPGGRLVTTVPDGQVEAQAQAAGEGRSGVQYMAEPRAEILEEVVRLVAEGRVRVHVAETFALDKAGEAQTRGEKDHPIGKLVLTPER